MNPTPLSLSTYGISIYSTLRKFPRDLSIKQKGCRNLENEKRKRQIVPKCDGCSMISRRHSSATPSTSCASSPKVTKIVSENDNTRHVYARVGHHNGKWFECGVGRKHRFRPEPTEPGSGFTAPGIWMLVVGGVWSGFSRYASAQLEECYGGICCPQDR